MAEATPHLPAYRPTEENEMPQGRKNWDKPPQQVDGPEGPEPHPTPKEAGAGRISNSKKPQHVDGPDGPEPPEPHGNTHPDDSPPQQVDGPEGPTATDGTELNDAAAAQAAAVDEQPHAAKKRAPAKATAAKAVSK